MMLPYAQHHMTSGSPHHSAIATQCRSGSPPPAKNGKDVKEVDAKAGSPAAKPSADSKAPAKAAEAQNGAAAKPAAKDGGRAADVSSTKLHVGKLTRNVTQEHMREIFATFGKLKSVELAMDRTVRLSHGTIVLSRISLQSMPKQIIADSGACIVFRMKCDCHALQVGLSRGFAYVEYEEAADAEEAKNNMHGGQLDGNVIT